MATHHTHNPATGQAADKLGDIDVNVTEIESDLPTPEFERLTIRSPVPKLQPIDEIMVPDVTTFHAGDRGLHFPRPASPTGSVRSSFGSSRRHVRHSHGHSHFHGGFQRGHRSEVSKELTLQAESEFFALVELMSSMSRRSSSLKEVWTKIISERESCFSEMDRMYERFDEYTEIIERKESESHHHTHEHEERKKENIKLKLEIAAALNSVAGFKKKLHDRECELDNARTEISEYKDNFKYLKEEHEKTTTTLEETQLLLVSEQESCRKAKEDAERHESELRSLTHRYSELKTSHTEISSKYESSSKEVTSLTQTVASYKKEKHTWLHEKGELEEGLRKCNHRCGELRHRIKELEESYEKKESEVRELTETIHKYKHEIEELHRKLKELRRQKDEEHCHWEDAEDRCGKWKLKWEHSEREVSSRIEEIRVIEVQLSEYRETITKKSEEIKSLTIEKERFEECYHDMVKKHDESHRHVLVLKESLRRTETTIKEKTELIHTLHERIERTETDRDSARGRCGDLEAELATLNATIVSIKLEIETVSAEREYIRKELHECETRYEEVCESITEFQEGSSGFEYEISNLRLMLKEVRDQKEKAITMRYAADRERDEAIARYEEKCRELEKLEESYSHYLHSERRAGSRTVSGGRTVTRKSFFKSSGSTVAEGCEEDDASSVVGSNNGKVVCY